MKRISLVILIIVVIVLVILKITSANWETDSGQPAQQEPEITYIWKIDSLDIVWVKICLEKQGLSQAWEKHEDKYFYFDEPGGSIVDMDRWGGGVPLLLGGPAAAKKVAVAEDEEKLDIYGLAEPSMLVSIKMADGAGIEAEVGDKTPNAMGYYIKLAGSPQVFIVDYTWYDILENLVLDPPYPKEAES